MNQLETQLAINNYLSFSGCKTLKLCEDFGFNYNAYTGKTRATFLGILMSQVNRAGGGNVLEGFIKTLAAGQKEYPGTDIDTQIIPIIKSAYDYANAKHPLDKQRWRTDLQNYNSEYWAITEYLHDKTTGTKYDSCTNDNYSLASDYILRNYAKAPLILEAD